jgi:hypothetical protein
MKLMSAWLRLSSVAVNCSGCNGGRRFTPNSLPARPYSQSGWATVQGPGGRRHLRRCSTTGRPDWSEPDVPAQMHLDLYVDDYALTSAGRWPPAQPGMATDRILTCLVLDHLRSRADSEQLSLSADVQNTHPPLGQRSRDAAKSGVIWCGSWVCDG